MTTPLDLKEILERFGDDMDMLREIVALFLEEYAARLDDVRLAIGSGDPARVTMAAHTFKGMVANFSHDAAGAAQRLETLGRSGNLGAADEAFAALEEKIADLVPSLATLVAEKVC